MITIETRSAKETQKAAALLARECIKHRGDAALVIALEGNLGSGKTTFVQGFARALGVKENVLSPTFVLLKIYRVGSRRATIRHLVHIDCYRLDSPNDILHLGFCDLLKDRDAIVLVEWADQVKTLLPRDALWIRFRHGKRSHERLIQFKMQNTKIKITE